MVTRLRAAALAVGAALGWVRGGSRRWGIEDEPLQRWERTRVVSRRFVAAEDQVKEARKFVADILGPCHPCFDSALLLTSELAANAVQHSVGTHFLVAMTGTADRVRVAVRDGGSDKIPHVRQPEDGETGGRGLMLVDAIALRWGFHRKPGQTIVWFTLKE